MMRLRDIFLVSVYVLFAEATALLVLGEGMVFPQAVGFPLVVVALVLVDRRRKLRVPSWMLNIAATGAVAAAAWEFTGESASARLTAAAHLLVYLGWVVLLGGKADRQYWWLLTLSVLQVASGAVLVDASEASLFSLLMVVFMVTGTWTLSVFSLQQVQNRFAAVPVAVKIPEGPNWLRPTAVGNGCQLDADQQWVNPRFILGVAVAAGGALVIAATFFVLIPRMWLLDSGGLDESEIDVIRPMTGFAETVKLGEIGEILESNKHVMNIELTDRSTGKRVDVEDVARSWGDTEPMFRGTVMVRYAKGKWECGLAGAQFDRMPGVPSGTGGIRQDVQLESVGTPVLFGMHPVDGCRIDSTNRHGLYQSATGVLVGSKNLKRGRVLHYSLFSPPRGPAADRRLPAAMSELERLEYLQLPHEDLDRLSETARGLVGERPGLPDAEKARRLMEFLAGEQFGYSLNASVADPDVDPIEDFVFLRRRGHCEYFASSLAMMLRAVEIPSRLVSGFKGGVHNQVSGQFAVHQRHAHAWVEAWIDSRWVTLDPTPAARDELIERLDSRPGFLRDAGQVLEHSWRRYVVELSLDQQQSLFYLPLQAGLDGGVSFTGELLSDAMAAFGRLATGRGAGERWPALLAVIGMVGLCVVVAWLVRRWRRDWRPRGRREVQAARSPPVVVPIYERFSGMMAADGKLRGGGQTAREFAVDVAKTLGKTPCRVAVDPIPHRVIDMYYAIRFGGLEPESDKIAEINGELDRLEGFLLAGDTAT